jgi:hypothetical protein
MTVYSVNTSKFVLDHQTENWLCWCATVKCVADYHGIAGPDQKGIATAMGKSNQPGPPVQTLRTLLAFTNSTVIDHSVADASQAGARATEIGEQLKGYLQFGPMIGALTTHDDSKWTLSGSTTPYRFLHAVVFWKYDDSTGLVSMRDPARKAPNTDFQVKLSDLPKRFTYMQSAELGPKALDLLVSPPATIDVRLQKLYNHMPPKL